MRPYLRPYNQAFQHKRVESKFATATKPKREQSELMCPRTNSIQMPSITPFTEMPLILKSNQMA